MPHSQAGAWERAESLVVSNRSLPLPFVLVPKFQFPSAYTSPAKPEKPSFRQGCRNPGHGR